MSARTLFISLFIAVFACFSPALRNELLYWDDFGFIWNNEHIRSLSFETVRWALTTYYCNYWMPVTWLSLALDHALFGNAPFGFHLTNIIIHAMNTGLYFLICRRLLEGCHAGDSFVSGKVRFSRETLLYCSFLAALLFGVHPLRVESVVWATERKDVLAMCFGLLAVLFYLRYSVSRAVRSPGSPFSFFSSPDYWCLLGFFTLSLGSKAMFVVLPVMLLVLDWYPLRRLNATDLTSVLLEKVPPLLLSGAVSYLTMQATAPTRGSYSGVTLLSRILTAAEAIVSYIKLFLLPTGISTVYLNKGNVAVDAGSLFNCFVVVAVTLFCCTAFTKRPVMLSVWLLFLIPLAPVLSVSGIHSMAARFTYLPSLSFSLVAALAVFLVIERFRANSRSVTAIIAAVSLVLVSYAGITVRDIGFWKDDITLWSRVIELQPDTFGYAYMQRSYMHTSAGDYPNALADIGKAMEIAGRKKYGNMHELYGERARILGLMGRYDAALEDLGRAIDTSNDMFRGKYYRERAKIHTSLGSHERAEEDAKRALQYPYVPGVTD